MVTAEAPIEINNPLRRLAGDDLGAPDTTTKIEAGLWMPPGSLGVLTGRIPNGELSKRPDILYTPREIIPDRED